MVPPDNDVFITKGLICNVVLELESESAVELELLNELSELEVLNESLELPQETKMRPKRNVKII